MTWIVRDERGQVALECAHRETADQFVGIFGGTVRSRSEDIVAELASQARQQRADQDFVPRVVPGTGGRRLS